MLKKYENKSFLWLRMGIEYFQMRFMLERIFSSFSFVEKFFDWKIQESNSWENYFSIEKFFFFLRVYRFSKSLAKVKRELSLGLIEKNQKEREIMFLSFFTVSGVICLPFLSLQEITKIIFFWEKILELNLLWILDFSCS